MEGSKLLKVDVLGPGLGASPRDVDNLVTR